MFGQYNEVRFSIGKLISQTTFGPYGLRLYGHVARLTYGGSHPSNSVFSGPEGLDHAQEPPAWFMIASGGSPGEGYGQDGPSVCLLT